MLSQRSGIDIVAYDREGQVLLLAETKSRRGTSESWAARLRGNMLSHGSLPWSKYFLIATPERMYLWKRERPDPAEAPPEFTIDAEKVLQPYFQRLQQEPLNIGPEAFELIVLTWLSDITRSGASNVDQGPSSAGLSELTGSLQQARIEMNSMQ
jgi:hypothetical protein